MNLTETSALKEAHGQKFDFKKIISTYTKQWKWFLLSLIVLLGGAYLSLRYTQPIYEASANIMLTLDDTNSADEVFKDLALNNEDANASIEDEILVFKSRSLLKTVVEKLNLNIQYFTQGLVLESEIYGKPPIQLNFIASDSIINNTYSVFYIDILSDKTYSYRENEDDTPTEYSFGETNDTPFGGMIVLPANNNFKQSSIRVKIEPINTIVEQIRNDIDIYPSKSSSKVLYLYLKDRVVNKAKDILNTLIYEYDKYSVDLNNEKSINTAKFIDSRVELIAQDLVNVDDSIVRFKTGNKVTDVSSEAGQFMSISFANEQQIETAKTQLRLLNYTKQLLSDNSNTFQMLPTNLGDPSISSLSAKYNELLAQRQNLLKSAGEKNSIVIELDQTLKNIRTNLTQNIDATTRTLNIQMNSLENQSQRVNSKIYSVPGQESRLRSIERKQGIKESIYLYLLQKREEALISQTVTSSNVKIIDEAYSLGKVSPQGKMLYIGALFLGLLIPFSFFYVKDLLDTKIHNKEDLQQEIKNITILGEIPRVTPKDKSLIERNDRSILSESFRIIRTNFDYVRRGRDVKQYDNVVFITSTVNGEGKSFFSLNMALTLANTNKSVLLIGADIRNPQIHNAIKQKSSINAMPEIGLTEFLVDKSVLLGETINEYDINNIKIDVLLSGKIPPNPAELLMNDRMKDLFDAVSDKYDYVIVDTAPAMLVTDTLLISQYAGHTIYVTRAGYTEKQILSFAKDMHLTSKLKGMMLVVNDVAQDNFGYGAKYGYYGAAEKKSFFKRKNKA